MKIKYLQKDITKIQGIAFGTMDGVINILGVMAGIGIATESKLAVVAGILAAGLANSLASSSGFYVVEETEGIFTEREVVSSTILAFITSFLAAIILLIPILFLSLNKALWLSLVLGILLLFLIGVIYSHGERKTALKIGLKYSSIGLIVVVICYFLGKLASLLI